MSEGNYTKIKVGDKYLEGITSVSVSINGEHTSLWPVYDMRGCIISVGDTIAYGKSSRYDPIAIGEVKEVNSDNLLVMGRGNSKGGYISNFNRVIVLPDDYINNVEVPV